MSVIVFRRKVSVLTWCRFLSVRLLVVFGWLFILVGN